MTNIADLVRQSAQERPDHTAIVSGETRMSWSELDRWVDTAARSLQSRGLATGERVGLMAANTPSFVISYFGILRAGLVAMPLNPGYTATEVASIAQLSGAKLMLADKTGLRAATSAAKKAREMTVVELDADTFAADASEAAELTVPTVDADDLAVLLFTSGSEGTPKGVMLSHRSLLANIEALALVREPSAMSAEDVVFLVLPLFHVYGLNAGLGLATRLGATIVLQERWDARRSLALIKSAGVTNIAGAPPMYIAWSDESGLRESLADVRLLVSGGSALPPEVYAQFLTLAGKPIWEGYGMTEASPVITSTVVSGKAKPGSVGRPVSGMSISIRDASGGPSKEGDPGNVWVKGSSLFSGYWPDGHGGVDDEGWFHTGDVGFVDDDGDLNLVDRLKDLIIVSGFNVYPREVENALETAEGVAESAVVGVPHPLTGEAVKALVVPKKGAEITPEAIRAHCETRLARFKCPSIIEVVPRLPHVSTGKVARAKLRDTSR